MSNWPSAGTVRDLDVERNLRILRKRGGELATTALRLVTAANRKVNFGSDLIEWPGGSPTSSTLEIEHGLGVTPIAVVANLNQYRVCTTFNFTSTKFSVGSRTVDGTSPAAGTKQTATWIAVG